MLGKAGGWAGGQTARLAAGAETVARLWSSVTARLPACPPARAAVHVLRQLAGMPDYAAHLEHLRARHPERPAPSEREFYEEFVRARYADGPTRCC